MRGLRRKVRIGSKATLMRMRSLESPDDAGGSRVRSQHHVQVHSSLATSQERNIGSGGSRD